MNYILQLKKIIRKIHFNRDGEVQKALLNSELTPAERKAFQAQLPNSYLPKDIEKLLSFSRGIIFPKLDNAISFTDLGYELNDFFPHSIRLTVDGFGNSWFLDIDNNGNWKDVYFAGHSPAVIIKISSNLSEFLVDINEYSNYIYYSSLTNEYPINEIVKSNKVQIQSKENTILDLPISRDELPDYFKIFDLTSKEKMLGFSIKNWDERVKIIRVKNKPIWVIECKKH